MDTSGSTEGRLIVSYIPDSVTEDELRAMFGGIGPLKYVKLLFHEDGTPRDIAFVTYYSQDDARKAVATLDGHPMLDKHLKVSFVTPREAAAEHTETKLCVRHIPGWTEEEMREHFGKFGKIIECRILDSIDYEGHLPGPYNTGFIRYDRHFEAVLALRAMNGIPVGNGCRLKVRFATPAEDLHRNHYHDSR